MPEPERTRPSEYTSSRVVASLILSIAVALPAFAQTQAPPIAREAAPSSAPATPEAAAAAKLTFEVASVRPGPKYVAKGWDFLDPVNKQAPPKGGLFSWNTQIGNLIVFAYDLRSSHVRQDVWKQLPQWAQDEWYTIEARAEGEPSRQDVQQMVRSLLEERFKFAGHIVTREGQVNALVVAKPGLGLKLHAEGASCELTLTPSPTAYPPYKDFPVRCGVFNRELSRYKRRLEMVDVTMQQIADTVSTQFPLPVVDATGLTGHYDAVLDYGPGMVPQDADPDAEVGSPVSEGLEKQLGLKLVKQNATIDVFVIDHIEKPSEN